MNNFNFKYISTQEYEGTPPQDVFDDIKAKATLLWNTYDNTHGYVKDKLDLIKPLKNFKDNAWSIVSMFDQTNQAKLWKSLEPATILYLETFLSKGKL